MYIFIYTILIVHFSILHKFGPWYTNFNVNKLLLLLYSPAATKYFQSVRTANNTQRQSLDQTVTYTDCRISTNPLIAFLRLG